MESQQELARNRLGIYVGSKLSIVYRDTQTLLIQSNKMIRVSGQNICQVEFRCRQCQLIQKNE